MTVMQQDHPSCIKNVSEDQCGHSQIREGKKKPQGNESLDWQKEMCKDRSEKEKLLMNVFSST